MFHLVDDHCRFCGYAVVEVSSIKATRLEGKKSVLNRALLLRGERPAEQPGVSLAGWEKLFLSIKEMVPLVAVLCERVDDKACWIGQVRRVSRDAVTIREISTSARWEGARRFEYQAITYVAWGAGYEEALWAVAQDNEKRAMTRRRKKK
jgi:hypothetical protein